MAVPSIGDHDFIRLYETIGPIKTAIRLGVHKRKVFERRERLEKKLTTKIFPPGEDALHFQGTDVPGRLNTKLSNGHVLIGSDSHYWPGFISTAHRAFVKFNKEFKPKIVIKNGDELDFASISRHPPIGWEDRPTVVAELETTQERQAEIEDGNKNATYYWPLGNHDARFETRLASIAPEYAKVRGVHLKDHFPRWEPCWSLWLNDIVIKHRCKGGIHATHNNALWAGKTMVTGHLHSLKVTPLTDYNGTRYGVDCGTMADIYGPQFQDYMEDNPRNWRSGFILLTFHKGRLLWPEIIFVCGLNQVEFRGKVLSV